MLRRICSGCRTISSNRKNNIWVHRGEGALSILPPIGTILDVKTVFNQPTDIVPDGHKPHGCIWFSRGGWSIYGCEYHRCSPALPIRLEEKSEVVIATYEPANILEIQTFPELNSFVDKYGTPMFDQKTRAKKQTIATINDRLHEYGHDFSREEVFEEMCRILAHHMIPYDRFISVIRESADTHRSIQHIAEKLTHHIPEIVPIAVASNQQMTDLSLSSFFDPVGAFLGKIRTFRPFYSYICMDRLQKIPDTFVRDRTSIDWYRVQGDGYYGVSFDFRQIADIVPPGVAYNRYDDKWHIGFDVESLCVFDTRALTNLSVSLMKWKI